MADNSSVDLAPVSATAITPRSVSNSWHFSSVSPGASAGVLRASAAVGCAIAPGVGGVCSAAVPAGLGWAETFGGLPGAGGDVCAFRPGCHAGCPGTPQRPLDCRPLPDLRTAKGHVDPA
jgi:hypothetical protein